MTWVETVLKVAAFVCVIVGINARYRGEPEDGTFWLMFAIYLVLP